MNLFGAVGFHTLDLAPLNRLSTYETVNLLKYVAGPLCIRVVKDASL